MKRYIRSSSNNYDNRTEVKIGSRLFSVYYTTHDELIAKACIQQLRPYDDADYTWAKVEGPQVSFIRNGKVIDKMTIADYDEDDVAGSFEQYLQYTFESIAMELLDMNKDIKPRMIHN